MRVMHVILKPRYSGAETVVCALAAAHQACGDAVGIVALEPPENAFRREMERTAALGVHWHTPSTTLSRFGRIRLLRHAFEEFLPDVVAAHSPVPAAYARLATLFRASPPVVNVLHGEDDYASAQLRLAERLFHRRTASVVSVSARAAAMYARRCGRGPTVSIIPNGIAMEAFSAGDRIKARRELGVDVGTKVVLQVGRICALKGQIATFEAVRLLSLRGLDVQFWIAGLIEDQRYHSDLSQRVRASGLDARVTFLGSRLDVSDLLAGADVFAMPSSQEAHSIAFLEALASGIAVCANNIPSFLFAKEMAGVSLLNCNNVEALASSLASQLKRGRRSVRDLAAFSLERSSGLYRQLFVDLVRRYGS